MGAYTPSTRTDREEMLSFIGVEEISDLFADIPEAVRFLGELELPTGKSEFAVKNYIQGLAAKNKVFPTICRGAGAYLHYIPSIVKRIAAKDEFVTSYTPYQAEISQGVLQSIFEYQTMICELTGMAFANASVYDGATAAAEAINMTKERKRSKALVSASTNPETISVIQTYAFATGGPIEIIPTKDGKTDLAALEAAMDDSTAAIYMQQPNYFGIIEEARAIADIAHKGKAKLIMGCYPIALGILESPGEVGADVAVGEGQPLGLALGFGGPYLGFMATTKAMMRKLPGRIVGETKDVDGKRAFVLTLQAREQHIRREKAASNICSNQALCAFTAAVYMAVMGEAGIKEVATQSYHKAHYGAKCIAAVPGFDLVYEGEFFNEFVTACPVPAEKALKALEEHEILGGYPLTDNQILWCFTEMNSKEEIEQVAAVLQEVSR